jgi:hypothetical protein
MAVIREERSNSRFNQLLAPVAIAADKADIEALDITGFDSASFTVMIGAANVEPADDKHVQIRLTHSNDNVNFTDCPDSEVLGSVPGLLSSGTFAHLKAAPAANTAYMAAYIGDKRYIRPVIKVTGDLGNGVIIGIGAMLQGTKYRPVVE